jgi:hypothetical protein
MSETHKVHFFNVAFVEFGTAGGFLDYGLSESKDSTSPTGMAYGFDQLGQDVLDIAMAVGAVCTESDREAVECRTTCR